MDKEIELSKQVQSATLRPNFKDSQEGKPGNILVPEVQAKTKGD